VDRRRGTSVEGTEYVAEAAPSGLKTTKLFPNP
jgi:hypothetical protein